MNISIEHILLFLIMIFLFYHFLGNCGCVKKINGFSVGGQSASSTCKCNVTNYCDNNHKKLCESNKDIISCTCPDGNNDPSCKGNQGILKNLGCMWSKCNSSSFDKEKNIETYTFDLTPLNLDPKNGSIIYEITGDPNIPLGVNWKLNGQRISSSSQLAVLNCLQEQVKIKYIGVNNNGILWYDYQVLAGINSGAKGADLTFSGPGVKEETLSIDRTSKLIHDTNYSSDNPIITKLIVVQDN